VSNRPNRSAANKRRVTAARTQPSGNRTIWIVVGVLVVVALAAIIAVAVTQSEEPVAGGGASPSGGTVVPSGSLDYGDVQVTGSALAQLPRGGTDTAVGETVPTITGVSFDDAGVTIEADGQPKIIMLLAHWCPHCQAEVPRIQEWLDENGMPSDVGLYAIATGTDSSRPNHPPGDWLREEGWSVPTLLDDEAGTAAQALGLSSYPFFVVVDGEGQVVLRTSGELTVDQWEALLEAARTGTTTGGGAGGESSPAG
jgi:thiol-disulfide isomerase/thioredoxin